MPTTTGRASSTSSPAASCSEIKNGCVVIVAGFQGITKDSDVTTLGRGGSDTTAVALAASLGAKVCERYTDVEGIYTADPRVVPEASKLKEISYDEMLELASYGSKVMHPRAVELGQIYNIPILVASSFNDHPGTLIHGGPMEIRNKVTAITQDMDVAKITIVGVPDRPGIAAAIFEPLAKAGVSVDTIVQNASIKNITDLTFTVTKGDAEKALKVVKPIAEKIGARECVADTKLAKVSIIGTGMQNTPGYASTMFSTLYAAGINIQLITTSEIRITSSSPRTRPKRRSRRCTRPSSWKRIAQTALDKLNGRAQALPFLFGRIRAIVFDHGKNFPRERPPIFQSWHMPESVFPMNILSETWPT